MGAFTILTLFTAVVCVYGQPRLAVMNGPGVPFGRPPPPPPPPPFPGQLPPGPGPRPQRFIPGPIPFPGQRRIPLRPNFVPGGQLRQPNMGVPLQAIGGPVNLAPPPQQINIGAPPVSFVGNLQQQNVRPSFVNFQGQGVGPGAVVELQGPMFGQAGGRFIPQESGQVAFRGGIPFVGAQQLLPRNRVPVVVTRPPFSIASPGFSALRPSGFSTATRFVPQPATTTTVIGPSNLNGLTGTFGGFTTGPITTINGTIGTPATVPILDSTPTLSQVNTIGTQVTSLTPSVATTPDELVFNAVNTADSRFTFTDPTAGQVTSGGIFTNIPGNQIMTGQPQIVPGTATTFITSGGPATVSGGQTVSGGVLFAGSDSNFIAQPGQPQPTMNMLFPGGQGTMTTTVTGSAAGGRCSANSCSAGQVCVYGGQYLCPDYIDFIDCRCQAGCYAKNTFIPDGVQNMQVDTCGNTCSCDSSDPGAEPGAARCTMIPCPDASGSDVTGGATTGAVTMVDTNTIAMENPIVPSGNAATVVSS